MTALQVRNPRLLASYATPPHSKFLTAPRSVFQKGDARRPHRRFTYAAIRHDDLQARSEITGFVEEVQSPASTATSQPQHFRFIIDDLSVHSIELIPDTRPTQSQNAPHDVLVIYKHGKVQRISADLRTIRWTATAPSSDLQGNVDADPKDTLVEIASIVDAKAAARGILKDRQDVFSAIGCADERSDFLAAIPLLFLKTRGLRQNSLRSRMLRVFSLNPTESEASYTLNPSQIATLPCIATWSLPPLEKRVLDESVSPEYWLCTSFARLFELSETLTIYDLSGLVPRVISTFHAFHQARDLLPLSSSFLMVGNDKVCAVYNTRFNSLQALFNCAQDTYPDHEMQAQETAVSRNPRSGLKFITHYPDSGLAVALQHNIVIGFQLSASAKKLKRKRGSGRLIDSIQKGVNLQDLQPHRRRDKFSQHPVKTYMHGLATEVDETWKNETNELDSCVKANNVEGFEEILFRSKVPLSSTKIQQSHNSRPSEAYRDISSRGTNERPPSFHLSATSYQVKYQPSDHSQSKSETFEPLDKRKATYALGKIFAIGPLKEPRHHLQSCLYIKFFPLQVFRRLANSGHVTLSTIAQALSEHDPSYQRAEQLELPDIIKAIFNFDTQGGLLATYLQESPHLDVFEILQAIQVLISIPDTHRRQAIENVDHEKHKLQNGVTNTSNDAQLTTMHKVALATAIAKLSSFPSKRIVQATQATLTPQEVKAVIVILRQQLSEGGWLFHYVHEPIHHTERLIRDKPSLAVITRLLNCVIDAVGVSGWLISRESQDTNRLLLSQLRAETSAALESIHETQSLRDILTEFSKTGPSKTLSTPFTGRSRFLHDRASSPTLPLSNRQDAGVSEMKVGPGGRVIQRSRREIGHELNKRVGEYSLDRIRF